MADNSSPTNNSSSARNLFLKREEIQGKSVLGLDANTVGTVSDLGISPEGKIAIQVNLKKKAESDPLDAIFLSSDEILAIGDVVLLRHTGTLAGKSSMPPMNTNPVSADPALSTSSNMSPPRYPLLATPATGTAENGKGKTCVRCNYLNGANSRFCIKCGTALM